ncbi:MAG: hypothetical protein AABX53_03245 [Nanoarchaeota archaeon]
MGLIERSTVEFERPLAEGELVGLMGHLQTTLGVREIGYILRRGMTTPPREHETDLLLSATPPEMHSLEISGLMYASLEQIKKGANLLPFEGYSNIGCDARTVSGLRFITTPGYDEPELPAEELRIMDKTREATHSYISGLE